MSDIPATELGLTWPDDRSTPLHLDGRARHREAAIELARSANQTIEILSRDLEPAVYDNQPFLDALTALVTGNRKAQVRVLVMDPGVVMHRGHRLIEQARHLSSYIALRTAGADHQDFNEALLIVDGRGWLHRRLADRFEGVACLENPPRARNLLGLFNEIWAHGHPDPELRRLHL